MCENIEKTQVVIPRLGQGENLLGAYALEVTGVTKGRGSLFIHTEGAVYMLKSFTGSMEKAQGLAQVLAELKAWDPAVEQILPTQEGAYAVREEGGPTYVLKSYQPGGSVTSKMPLRSWRGQENWQTCTCSWKR